MAHVLKEAKLEGLKLFNTGKVREIYEFHSDKLLIVTTDRISAFDVIMEEGIPEKGIVLTKTANFWFDKFKNIIKNHIVSTNPANDFPELKKYEKKIAGRSIVVHKCKPLPIEAIVRGYLAGSGLKEYKKEGTVCGIPLPKGLTNSSKLPKPIFTPSTKAEQGLHDENISFEKMKEILGDELSEKVKSLSLKLYTEGAEYARKKGIIIADTKFEFGLLGEELILIDEVLTQDSSRFWPQNDYEEGRNQKSFDKQYLRDYLQELTDNGKWDKNSPAPKLPEEILRITSEKYQEALNKLTK